MWASGGLGEHEAKRASRVVRSMGDPTRKEWMSTQTKYRRGHIVFDIKHIYFGALTKFENTHPPRRQMIASMKFVTPSPKGTG